ncbi:MAG: nickel pincer cofactor biosynthesis protein LarC [bacterium]
MKIAYLDCSSGISGDMLLGALVDAGVSLRHIRNELAKIPLSGYSITSRKVSRSGIAATKVDVKVLRNAGVARKWKDVERIISRSKLDSLVKNKGYRMFERLFEAEAAVHGKKPDHIHLHELGAVDCMVDVFGALIGMKHLGIEKLFSSPVNLGSGMVKTEHGALPIPAPATLRLLSRAEVYGDGSGFELSTPTGALILSSLCEAYGPIPSMRLTAVGHGAGTRDVPTRPNVARLIIGETPGGETHDEIFLVETNIDDMNPQWYDHVVGLLFRAGALDVYLTSIFMKKQRPGIMLSILTREQNLQAVSETVLRETTSIGVRFCRYGRMILPRETVIVRTRYGKVRFKKIYYDGKTKRMIPEYEDCKRIAMRRGVPIGKIIEDIKVSME